MVEISASCYTLNDVEKFYHAGINTVIFSMPFFSARPAGVFSLEEIKAGTQKAHQLGMKSAVNLTRFFTEEECEKCKAALVDLKAAEVDQIYFTDCCVLWLAKELNMEDKLIYNPDTLITNASDAQFYLDQKIQMVTLSKEITLDEMCQIASKVKGNLEVIIHGRLNMMHSKRRLLSSYFEFIGKEVDCINQHDMYLMEENRDERMPIVQDELGTHVFTGFTLCAMKEVKPLMEAGISHMRIESLFMNSDEVAQCAMDYRKVLNGEADGTEMFNAYREKYASANISDGFMYKKTSLTKV